MLRKSITTLFVLALTSLTLHAQKPATIPETSAWTATAGSFVPQGRILVRDARFMPTARILAADYKTLLERDLSVVDKGKPKVGDIVLQAAKERGMGSEGYRLAIGEKCATLTAETPRAALWGVRTLLQMSELSTDGTLPCGVADDRPAYALRGFMIDCGRKYIPMNYLRSLVRVMSYYKMNTLQVHLNDNGFPQYFGNDWAKTQSAFRLQSDYFPELTARDGSYTKQEFRQFVRFADSLGVEIIPEIDVPAHSLAFTHFRPSLASKDCGFDHLDISSRETYAFLDSLFAEYLAGPDPVFCTPRVHIGTDEYSNRTKALVEQFRAFTDHYLRLVRSYGKQPVCWGSLTHAKGDTPVLVDSVLMMLWSNDFAKPDEMLKLGYQVISIPDGYIYIVPAAGYYSDYLDCPMLYEEWTPAQTGRQRLADDEPLLHGGMFALWNDHVGNGISVSDIHDRVLPAMKVISAKTWSGAATTLPYATFDSIATRLSEAPGVNESGRLLRTYTAEAVQPNAQLVSEAACYPAEAPYGSRISFTVDCQKEAKGTILTLSDRARFYLADPQQGLVGFERDNYLDTFPYRLPETGTVELCIESTAKGTTLFANGKKVGDLQKRTLYATPPAAAFDHQTSAAVWHPQVIEPTNRNRMFYLSTLQFPLARTGQFNSKISKLRVEPLAEASSK